MRPLERSLHIPGTNEPYGPEQERWHRLGHAARFIRGLRSVWNLPFANGRCFAFIPAEYTASEREAAFARLLAEGE